MEEIDINRGNWGKQRKWRIIETERDKKRK